MKGEVRGDVAFPKAFQTVVKTLESEGSPQRVLSGREINMETPLASC